MRPSLWTVTPRFKADIQTNILECDPRSYPPGYFDTIFAAPPCTEYSIAMTSRVRDLDTADSIVRCTLRIIAYFEPKTWVIENPATGLLKSRGILDNTHSIVADYCRFAPWGYCKKTQFWGNSLQKLKSIQCQPADCPNMTLQFCPLKQTSRWKH